MLGHKPISQLEWSLILLWMSPIKQTNRQWKYDFITFLNLWCGQTGRRRWLNSKCTSNPASKDQNLPWKLGQQIPSFGSLLAYLETTAKKIFSLGIKLFFDQDRKLKLSASVWRRISWNLTKFQLNQTIDRKNENNNCLNR